MKAFQVLGIGCSNCKRLAENVEAAARELGIDYTMEKVTDLEAIARAGIMRTPALAINGRVTLSGKVPSVSELKTILAQATAMG